MSGYGRWRTLPKMDIKAGDDLIKQLSKLNSNTNKIAKEMVRAGANPVADQIRKNLEANIKDPAYAGKGNSESPVKKNYGKSSGDLIDALGISPASIDRKGVINAKVGFKGYDSKGVPNALKARAMESGTSKLRKRPFVRPAVNKTKGKCLEEMQKAFDTEIKIYALKEE